MPSGQSWQVTFNGTTKSNSTGVFRVPSAPTIISGFKGITMQAAEANSTIMVVKITNNYNQFVNVTGITVNVNGNTYTSYSCLDSIVRKVLPIPILLL